MTMAVTFAAAINFTPAQRPTKGDASADQKLHPDRGSVAGSMPTTLV
jgi:hypothetical protein